ncbi:MAG: LLM class flavin-dependent oxidoreductase [Anaerolineae bacterium]|nr:LLM class flavin-dependent oxidoreductase [Anaerolineae bacterium]
MKFGVTIPNWGPYADIRRLAALAQDAESAGWDGFFVWDHVWYLDQPMCDPWVALGVIAMQTSTIRIGTMVTPIPRRRVYKLSREVISIDQLSNGRMILGVGIGSGRPHEYEFVGEETSAKARGAMLDEALDLLMKLWSGEYFKHEGDYYPMRGSRGESGEEIRHLPTPVNGHIPIWVGGNWPNKKPFRRAAKWQGVTPIMIDLPRNEMMPVDAIREVVEFVNGQREDDSPFEIVVSGISNHLGQDEGASLVAAYEEVGTTWWLEKLDPWAFGGDEIDWPVERIVRTVKQGPPE